jgi:uncharacterized protein YlxW (UPF0749 family)
VPPDWVFLVPFGGMATGIVFMVVMYKLIARWIDRRQVGSGASAEELRQLRDQVESLGDVADRVAELEERVDFAERMLAQQRREALPGGTGGV